MNLPLNPSQQAAMQNDGNDERSVAEPMLQESTIPWAAILEQMPDAFMALDTQWRILYLNAQAALLLQKSRDELLGSSIWEAFAQTGDALLFQSCMQARTTGKAVSFDYRAPASNTWFHVHVFPSAGGIGVYFQDITERKQAEASLRQSELRFRAIFNQSFAFLGVMMPDGLLIDVNELVLTAIGYQREQVVGKYLWEMNWWDTLPGEARKVKEAIFQASSGQAVQLEVAFYTTAGEKHFAAAVVKPLFDEAGKIIYLTAEASDITEHKQAEDRLRQSEKHFRALVENNVDGISLTDANGIFTYTSPSTTRLVGYPSDEVLGQRIFSRAYPEDREATERFLARVFAEPGKSHALEYRTRHRDGTFLWLEIIGTNLLNEPNIEAVIWNFHDITEHRQAEQRKDHFISMASHELKTPLTILSAYTQLLQEQFTAENRQDVLYYLSKMDGQINRLTKLVIDLLDISKMQVGQLELIEEVIDLNKLVHEMVENLQLTTAHRLLIEGTASRCVIGDKDRLRQVLLILLSNAIKYSPQADAVITRITQADEGVTVSVQDFGIGIAQSHQQKLFKRFYRVLSEKDQTYPGLGIGLYVAYEIIQHHGGTIWVESVEGKGSTFSFSLPMRE